MRKNERKKESAHALSMREKYFQLVVAAILFLSGDVQCSEDFTKDQQLCNFSELSVCQQVSK
jgi:hypothetical protein